jgi:recombinational DNA repair protein RecR
VRNGVNISQRSAYKGKYFVLSGYLSPIDGIGAAELGLDALEQKLHKQGIEEIIGTPSIIDPFHNNQWDYINHSIMGSGEVIRYRLTLLVFFFQRLSFLF